MSILSVELQLCINKIYF